MSQKLIVGLEGHGLKFKQFLRNLEVDSTPKYHETGARSDLDFVYNEAASQIMMIYEAEPQRFLVRLMQLPDIRFFAHLPQFNYPAFVQLYTEGFREFAMGIMFQIHRILGCRADVEYLLEAIADDYMVVFQAPRTQGM